MSDFWRKNVRPGTTFGPYSRAPTLWQRFYDWITGRGRPLLDFISLLTAILFGAALAGLCALIGFAMGVHS